jgi:hypothetical protein
MRRVHTATLTGLLALAALLAVPNVADAQQRTMRFRPVPPESAGRYEQTGAAAATDTAGIPAVPGVPEIPEVPPPTTRSTSGDIVRFGSDVTVEEGTTVTGDVVSFGGDIEIRGHVTGEVQALGGDLLLASTARVDGDVVCVGGRLREEDGSQVGGKRVLAGRGRGGKFLLPMFSMLGAGAKMMVHIVGMFIMLGFAWAFVKLAPERTRGALETIQQEPGPSFIIGLLLWALIIPSVIALALVIALLCITIIGIPLAAAVAVAYAAFFILASLWGSIVGYGVLGSRLFPRFKNMQPNLLQAVIWGGVAIHGLRIAGDLLHVVPLFGVLGGLFTFMHFVIAVSLGTLGAGALVRGEYRRRSVQTWWARMRPSSTSATGDMPPTSPPPPPPPPPPASSSSGAEIIS